jgi:hypothetical protein
MPGVKTGISKTVFAAGLIVAILASSLISVVAMTQLSGSLGLKGAKGDKGDSGIAGATGSTGATGAVGAAALPGMQGVQGLRGLSKPDYDSGWISIAPGQTMTLVHALNTTNVFVYMVGMDADMNLLQSDYGWNLGGSADLHYGAAWDTLNTSSINVMRGAYDSNWALIRVMIWKI